MKPTVKLSNTACGVFLISLIFFALLLGLNHFAPRPGSGVLLVLVALVGLAALGTWTWVTYQFAVHPSRPNV